MGEIGELARIAYDQFFKRDLLGKFGPGAIAALGISSALGVDVTSLLSRFPGVLSGMAAVSATYVAGVAVQAVGEILGLHSSSSVPRRIFGFFGAPRLDLAQEDFMKRLAIIRKETDNGVWSRAMEAQRERYVVLKEAAGNGGVALLLLSIALGVSGASIGLSATAGVVAVLALYSHSGSGLRQAEFEIESLDQLRLLGDSGANAMLANIRSGRQLTRAGADGRAIDGGRSAAAL